jgi:hypothetical protein
MDIEVQGAAKTMQEGHASRTGSRTGEPRRVTRLAAVAALGMSLFACRNEREIAARIDGPRRVEIVREQNVNFFGFLPGDARHCALSVEGPEPFTDEIACSRSFALEEDPSGDVVALRGAADRWWLLRLGKRHHFYDCAPPAGRRGRPDLAKVEPLSVAAQRILGCRAQTPSGFSSSSTDTLAWLGDEIRLAEGPARVAALFEATSHLPPAKPEEEALLPDPWASAAAVALRAEEREPVLRSLCPALADASAPPFLFLRAVALCDLRSPGIGEAAVARVAEAFSRASDARESGAAAEVDWLVFTWALRLSLLDAPTRAGAAGCAFLDRPHARYDRRISSALAAVAVGKTRCPAVEKELERPPCDEPPASAPQIAASLASWVESAEGLRRNEPAARDRSFVSKDKLLVAAALAQGPLPEPLARRYARLGYSVRQTGPSCSEQGEAGAPCACNLDVARKHFCSLPLDGSPLPIPGGHCLLRADDKRRLVGFATRICARNPGATCLVDADCCLELACAAPGAGTQSCQPVRSMPAPSSTNQPAR